MPLSIDISGAVARSEVAFGIFLILLSEANGPLAGLGHREFVVDTGSRVFRHEGLFPFGLRVCVVRPASSHVSPCRKSTIIGANSG